MVTEAVITRAARAHAGARTVGDQEVAGVLQLGEESEVASGILELVHGHTLNRLAAIDIAGLLDLVMSDVRADAGNRRDRQCSVKGIRGGAACGRALSVGAWRSRPGRRIGIEEVDQ